MQSYNNYLNNLHTTGDFNKQLVRGTQDENDLPYLELSNVERYNYFFFLADEDSQNLHK